MAYGKEFNVRFPSFKDMGLKGDDASFTVIRIGQKQGWNEGIKLLEGKLKVAEGKLEKAEIELGKALRAGKAISLRPPSMADRRKRPDDFSSLSPQEQWCIDKNLGILDWDGS